ncbi:MAG: cytochrome c family protein [Rhodoplanes sp.]|uniref:c-type cytochrome n=1 Tax=Rhodoplanes sp. TaxID=1968906 RepID=UPI0017A75470|nr:cytochrome c family protein [Rhodoplanes sp.]NVO17217.1 cytochrome c family protein [Rhodoplanes sp.]
MLSASLLAAVSAAADGDAVREERAFLRCYSCHTVDPDETATLDGPLLAGILGRRAATRSGFDYSDALRAAGEAGLTWDAATLDRFIRDPQAMVPGTRMSLPPLDDAGLRADIVAYLARTGGGP